MIVRALVVSIVVSTACLALVLAIPIKISEEHDPGKVSPYQAELSELRSRINGVGLSPEERDRYYKLAAKQNQWVDEYVATLEKNVGRNLNEYTRKVGARMAPMVAIIWAGIFYVFYSRYPQNSSMFVLTCPILFSSLQIISLAEMFAAVAGVVVIRSWFLFRPPRSRPT